MSTSNTPSTSETDNLTDIGFSFSQEYILDKSHFAETFDQSVVINNSPKRYLKAIAFIVAGFLMTQTDVSPYLAYFFIGLGAVEGLQVRFNRAWWLMRQLISKSANNPVTLTISEQGIHSKSAYIDHLLKWTDIVRAKETEQGFLLTTENLKHYVSKRCLNSAAINFIKLKVN
ncbi:YcxB family protein [Shewanella electrodiphila]|uniref:YcxB family protein n=1 Tax=Shewanella electrodiphila TaxID=934143 RepID=A0ABT0KJ81_9GAMM|nr:YcxB family protein [Shewanella electrodiphila]MCL1043903.1 YcxB family protein [Shewanella electrodiphila]